MIGIFVFFCPHTSALHFFPHLLSQLRCLSAHRASDGVLFLYTFSVDINGLFWGLKKGLKWKKNEKTKRSGSEREKREEKREERVEEQKGTKSKGRRRNVVRFTDCSLLKLTTEPHHPLLDIPFSFYAWIILRSFETFFLPFS